MTGLIFWTRHQESEPKIGLPRGTTVRLQLLTGRSYLAALLMHRPGKNLKSRIERLERQAAVMSTHQLLPTDGMPDISDYDHMPSGLVVPGLATRSNGFVSYSASPAEVPTFGLSDIGVDSKTPDTSSSPSTLPLLGIVCFPPSHPFLLFTSPLGRKRICD